MKREIDYDSGGVLVIDLRKGGADVMFFGDVADLLLRQAARLGLTPEQAAKLALDSAAKHLGAGNKSRRNLR